VTCSWRKAVGVLPETVVAVIEPVRVAAVRTVVVVTNAPDLLTLGRNGCYESSETDEDKTHVWLSRIVDVRNDCLWFEKSE
jgi:hypothetical protein